MSRKIPTGLTFAEKILGTIIALIGLMLTYYTYASLEAAGNAAIFILASGLLLMGLGLILLIAKTG